jgi:hypothetical protein
VLGLHVDGQDVAPAEAAHPKHWEDGWQWTLETLSARGASVVVSRILPTMPERVPACIAEHGVAWKCDFDVARDRRVGTYNEALERVRLEHDRVAVLDPTPMVCPDGRCPAIVDGVVVHRDDNHVSATYVRSITETFAALLDGAAGRARQARA